MPRALPTWTAAPGTAVTMVFLGLVCQEVGASISVLVFPHVGPLGMVALRLAFSAVVLVLVARPRLRGHGRRDWATVVGFGVVLGAMNALFYLAIDRIPLGIAVTIEVLGPLTLSVVLGRRPISWLWALLAAGGVVLLGGLNLERLDPVGVLFAALAGALWVGYILGSAATGRRFERLDGLAIAMVVGSVLLLPAGVITAGPAIVDPRWLGLGLAVALLSSAIPYALELLALRRLPESAFGVLMSLAPATAALAGFVLLGQSLTPFDIVAMGMVIAASAGAVLTAPPRAAVLDEPLA